MKDLNVITNIPFAFNNPAFANKSIARIIDWEQEGKVPNRPNFEVFVESDTDDIGTIEEFATEFININNHKKVICNKTSKDAMTKHYRVNCYYIDAFEKKAEDLKNMASDENIRGFSEKAANSLIMKSKLYLADVKYYHKKYDPFYEWLDKSLNTK